MLLERICALIMKSFCTISSTSFHIAPGCDVSSKTILDMVTKQTKKRKFNGDIVDYITESNNWFSEPNTLANTPQTVNWIKECHLLRYRVVLKKSFAAVFLFLICMSQKTAIILRIWLAVFFWHSRMNTGMLCTRKGDMTTTLDSARCLLHLYLWVILFFLISVKYDLVI